MYQRISYTLNVRDRAFPGAPTMSIKPFESMENGELLNTYQVTIFNHFGTHMDGPNHFNRNGKQLYELELSQFIFEKPLLLDIPKRPGEQIVPADLIPFEKEIQNADLLLIRSGFSEIRRTNNQMYSEEGPSVSSAAAQYIVDHFPELKAIGMDWISLSSPLHLDDGIAAHQILLGVHGNRPVLILEDLDLQRLDGARLELLFALPLFVEGIDSAPATVIAKLRD